MADETRCAFCGEQLKEFPGYRSVVMNSGGLFCTNDNCEVGEQFVGTPHPHYHYEGMNECLHCEGHCGHEAAAAPPPCCGTRHSELEGCPPERHCDPPAESAAPQPPVRWKCWKCGATSTDVARPYAHADCGQYWERVPPASAAPPPDTEIQNHSVRESAAPAAGEDTVHALGFYTTVRQRISAREMLTIDDACRFAAAYARSRCAAAEKEAYERGYRDGQHAAGQ